MSDFWPIDLDLTDCVSPQDILTQAQNEWESSGRGVFALVIRHATSESGNKMQIVYAKHLQSGTTSKLFQVVHRPDKPFPATIQPESEVLPVALRREYEKTVTSGFASVANLFDYQEKCVTVKNEWVATTPAEFRDNLHRMFQSDSVKSQLLNMLLASKESKPQSSDGADGTNPTT